MKRWILKIALSSLCVALFAGYASGVIAPLIEADQHEDASLKILLGRPWLDHLPEHEHDLYKAFIFDKKGYGVQLDASSYKGSWEVFVFRQKQGEPRLEIVYPHDKRRFVTRFHVSKAKHGTFDLKLTLDDLPTEPKVYYSWQNFRRDLPAADSLRAMALEKWLSP